MTPLAPLRRAAPALLVLTLAACGGDGSGSRAAGGSAVGAEGAPDAQTATVVGTPRNTFEPSTVTARAGTLRLTMRVDGGVPHDLVFADAALGQGVPTTSGGSATGTFVFRQAGTYEFRCTIHPGMDGRVVVS